MYQAKLLRFLKLILPFSSTMTLTDKSAINQFIAASSAFGSADSVSNFGESLASFTQSYHQLGMGGARDSPNPFNAVLVAV